MNFLALLGGLFGCLVAGVVAGMMIRDKRDQAQADEKENAIQASFEAGKAKIQDEVDDIIYTPDPDEREHKINGFAYRVLKQARKNRLKH